MSDMAQRVMQAYRALLDLSARGRAFRDSEVVRYPRGGNPVFGMGFELRRTVQVPDIAGGGAMVDGAAFLRVICTARGSLFLERQRLLLHMARNGTSSILAPSKVWAW